MSTAAEHDAASILATWGETITYTPKSGSPRQIIAVVDDDGEADFNDTTRALVHQEQLSVFVLRDKDDANYGGIDQPQLGDTITFDGDNPQPYGFSGSRGRSDRTAWTLQFTRMIDYEIGGNRRR